MSSRSTTSDSPLVVIGSLNIDYVSRVDELPAAGETVIADDITTCRGGKGANQAISASRQGQQVILFGSIGDDENGASYQKQLSAEGIDVSKIQEVPCSTGAAFITVDSDGENTIVVAGGANDFLTRDDILEGASVIEGASALLLQFEVPQPTIVEAISIANEHEVPVIINPSPANAAFPWHEVQTDYLIVNESEAEDLLEFEATFFSASEVRQRIHELRIKCLIVTRGSKTTLVFPNTGDPYEVDTLAVLAIDTVGAGDAFAGCFAAWIAAGSEPLDAIRAANCAGALTTLGGGAQRPIPDRERVEQHLEQIPVPKQT